MTGSFLFVVGNGGSVNVGIGGRTEGTRFAPILLWTDIIIVLNIILVIGPRILRQARVEPVSEGRGDSSHGGDARRRLPRPSSISSAGRRAAHRAGVRARAVRVGVGLGIICTVATTATAPTILGHVLDLDGPGLGLGPLGFLLLGDEISIGVARHALGAQAEAMGAASSGAIASGLDQIVASLGGLLQRQQVLFSLEFHGQLEVGGHNVLG